MSLYYENCTVLNQVVAKDLSERWLSCGLYGVSWERQKSLRAQKDGNRQQFCATKVYIPRSVKADYSFLPPCDFPTDTPHWTLRTGDILLPTVPKEPIEFHSAAEIIKAYPDAMVISTIRDYSDAAFGALAHWEVTENEYQRRT